MSVETTPPAVEREEEEVKTSPPAVEREEEEEDLTSWLDPMPSCEEVKARVAHRRRLIPVFCRNVAQMVDRCKRLWRRLQAQRQIAVKGIRSKRKDMMHERRYSILDLPTDELDDMETKIKRSSEDGASKDFSVGLVGCGRVGMQVALRLLDTKTLRPRELIVSSRNVRHLGPLISRGVTCFYDNARVFGTHQVIILCCLPHQLSAVGKSLGSLQRPSSSATVISLLSCVRPRKQERVLVCDAVLRVPQEESANPDFSLLDRCLYNTWERRDEARVSSWRTFCQVRRQLENDEKKRRKEAV